MSRPGGDAWSADDFGGFDEAFSPVPRDVTPDRQDPDPEAAAEPGAERPATAGGTSQPALQPHERARRRGRLAALGNGTAAFLTVVQVAVFVATGSSVALAGAAQSAASFLGSIVAGIAIRGEDRVDGPEAQAGRAEGIVVIAACLGVAVAALARLGRVPPHALPAATVVAGCAVISWLVAGRLRAGAEELGSRGVREDADLASSNGNRTILIALALALIALTGFGPLDAVAALVALLGVAGSAVDLIRSSRPGREGISPSEHGTIARVLAGGPPEVVGYRETSARTAAGMRRIDVVVTVRRDTPEPRLRQIWAATEPELARRLARERVVVHVERPAEETPRAERPGVRRA